MNKTACSSHKALEFASTKYVLRHQGDRVLTAVCGIHLSDHRPPPQTESSCHFRERLFTHLAFTSFPQPRLLNYDSGSNGLLHFANLPINFANGLFHGR